MKIKYAIAASLLWAAYILTRALPQIKQWARS
jgi:hypothetical protein